MVGENAATETPRRYHTQRKAFQKNRRKRTALHAGANRMQGLSEWLNVLTNQPCRIGSKRHPILARSIPTSQDLISIPHPFQSEGVGSKRRAFGFSKRLPWDCIGRSVGRTLRARRSAGVTSRSLRDASRRHHDLCALVTGLRRKRLSPRYRRSSRSEALP